MPHLLTYSFVHHNEHWWDEDSVPTTDQQGGQLPLAPMRLQETEDRVRGEALAMSKQLGQIGASEELLKKHNLSGTSKALPVRAFEDMPMSTSLCAVGGRLTFDILHIVGLGLVMDILGTLLSGILQREAHDRFGVGAELKFDHRKPGKDDDAANGPKKPKGPQRVYSDAMTNLVEGVIKQFPTFDNVLRKEHAVKYGYYSKRREAALHFAALAVFPSIVGYSDWLIADPDTRRCFVYLLQVVNIMVRLMKDPRELGAAERLELHAAICAVKTSMSALWLATFGKVYQVPKFHYLDHILASLMMYGSFRIASTESDEASHAEGVHSFAGGGATTSVLAARMTHDNALDAQSAAGVRSAAADAGGAAGAGAAGAAAAPPPPRAAPPPAGSTWQLTQRRSRSFCAANLPGWVLGLRHNTVIHSLLCRRLRLPHVRGAAGYVAPRILPQLWIPVTLELAGGSHVRLWELIHTPYHTKKQRWGKNLDAIEYRSDQVADNTPRYGLIRAILGLHGGAYVFVERYMFDYADDDDVPACLNTKAAEDERDEFCSGGRLVSAQLSRRFEWVLPSEVCGKISVQPDANYAVKCLMAQRAAGADDLPGAGAGAAAAPARANARYAFKLGDLRLFKRVLLRLR